VRRDQRLGVAQVARRAQVLIPHDARVVDQDVEVRVLDGDPLRERRYRIRGGDVELDCVHAASSRDGLFKGPEATSRHDDRVAEIVETSGELAADARASAGDEDGVACRLHGWLLRSNVSVGSAHGLVTQTSGGRREHDGCDEWRRTARDGVRAPGSAHAPERTGHTHRWEEDTSKCHTYRLESVGTMAGIRRYRARRSDDRSAP